MKTMCPTVPHHSPTRGNNIKHKNVRAQVEESRPLVAATGALDWRYCLRDHVYGYIIQFHDDSIQWEPSASAHG